MADEEKEKEEIDFDEWGAAITSEEITKVSSTTVSRTAKEPEDWRNDYEDEIDRSRELFSWIQDNKKLKYGDEKCFGIPIKKMYDLLIKNDFYNPTESTEELEGEDLQEYLVRSIPSRLYRIIGSAGYWRDPDAGKSVIRTLKNEDGKFESVDEGEYLLVVFPDYFEESYGDNKWERFVSGKQRAYSRKWQGDSLAKTLKRRCDFDDEISDEFIENVNRKIIEDGMGQDYDEEKEKYKEKKAEEEEEEEEEDEEEEDEDEE